MYSEENHIQERRQFVRFRVPFYLKCSSSKDAEEISAMAKDVSMGGLKVVLDRALDVVPENAILLSFLLPSRTLRVSGKVVWTKSYEDRKEAGVCFINIPDDHKEDIYNYIFKYYREELTRHWWNNKSDHG
ncbi:MAG: PilZ domain-containing protein [Candidatus Omnitrophota bacterium]|nr:MAG: PilZ domain-containing protein [Candidatus Omnitrophota bacterium]